MHLIGRKQYIVISVIHTALDMLGSCASEGCVGVAVESNYDCPGKPELDETLRILQCHLETHLF